MLTKAVAELIEKYSFVDKCYIKGATFIIEYNNKGKPLKKELPLRASTNQLKQILKTVQKKAGGTIYGKSKNEIYWF